MKASKSPLNHNEAPQKTSETTAKIQTKRKKKTNDRPPERHAKEEGQANMVSLTQLPKTVGDAAATSHLHREEPVDS